MIKLKLSADRPLKFEAQPNLRLRLEPLSAIVRPQGLPCFRVMEDFGKLAVSTYAVNVSAPIALRIVQKLGALVEKAGLGKSPLPIAAWSPIAAAAFEMAKCAHAVAREASHTLPFTRLSVSGSSPRVRLIEVLKEMKVDWQMSEIAVGPTDAEAGCSRRDEMLRSAIADRLWSVHVAPGEESLDSDAWPNAAADLYALLRQITRTPASFRSCIPPERWLAQAELPPDVPEGLLERLREEFSSFE